MTPADRAMVTVDISSSSLRSQVIDVVDKPAGRVVHLRILPGVIEDDEALVNRAITSAS